MNTFIRTQLYLSAILSVTFFTGYAQDGTTTITYNNKQNAFVSAIPRYVKEGDFIRLRYININPRAVQSHLSVQQYSALDTMPSYLSDIIKGAKGLAQLPEDTLASTRGSGPQVSESFKRSVLKSMADAEYCINRINQLLLLDSFIVAFSHDPAITSPGEFVDYVQRATLLQVSSDDDIRIMAASCLDGIHTALNDVDNTLTSMKAVQPAWESYPALSDFINEAETKAAIYRTAFSNEPLTGIYRKLGNIRSNYLAMISQEYSYTLQPILIEDDQVTISDSLTVNGQPYLVVRPMVIRSYGGFRINFSLGFAATFGHLNATGYFLVRDSANKIESIGSSRKNSVGNFSPIAFAHWMFRCKGALSPSVSVGFNPDFSSLSNSRLLIGASLGFTASNNWYNRFQFSFGFGMGLTDCLKPKFIDLKKEDFAGLQNISESDLTEKAFRVGGFIAISFNL